jgi:YVTN family beta-propeller protein
MAVLLAAAIALLAFAASAGAAPLVFTGNYDNETVSVINAQTHAPVGGQIPVGAAPSAIAIAPNGQAFVAEYGNDSVAVIDTKTLKVVTTIPVAESPEYVAVSPDGKTVYVTSSSEPEVTVINAETDTASGSITLGDEPYGIAVSPDGTYAYATVNDTLEQIDTATRKVVGEPIEVGEGPTTVAFAPNGATAYVANEDSEDVSIVDTAQRKTVGTISLPGSNPWGVAVSPDGGRLYVSDESHVGLVYVVDTQTRQVIGTPIPAGEYPYELALTPDGKTLWVAGYTSDNLIPIDTTTDTAGTPIDLPEAGPWQVAVTPDLSPTAVFSPPSVTAGAPATFSGAASTDPDGTIASYGWVFGDGGTATGVTATHTYATAGTYNAELSVVDNEGCGKAAVFTGRTAYCSGNSASVVHPVEAKVPPIVCSGRFRFGALSNNRRNGTARLQVKVPAAGSIFLFGKKVHAVTRKATKAGTIQLTIHPRVKLNKQLKKTGRAQVKIRVTFTSAVSCAGPGTLHRSLALLRAPRTKHSGH